MISVWIVFLMIFAGVVSFESGQQDAFNGIVGTAMTASATNPITGDYSGRCVAATSFGYAHTGHSGGSAGALDYFQFRLRITTYPSAECRIASVYLGATPTEGFHMRLTTAGRLKFYSNAASPVQLGSDSEIIPLETTVLVEMAGDWSNNLASARLNGGLFATNASCNYDTDNYKVGMGVDDVNLTTGEWFVDDILGVRNTGSGPQSWPAGMRIKALIPDGAGDADTNVAVTGGGGNAHTALAERPPDDDTSYIAATGTGVSHTCDVDMRSCADAGIPVASTIQLVLVGTRLKTGGTANHSYHNGVKSQSGGTVTGSGNVTLNAAVAWHWHDDTATVKTSKVASYTDPQAGGSWTTALLDTAQMRIGGADNNPGPPRYTFGFLQVVYSELMGPGIGPAVSMQQPHQAMPVW